MRIKNLRMRNTGGVMQPYYVGVDLHKTQFTVCILCNDEVFENGTLFTMNQEGFTSFVQKMQQITKKGDSIKLAIESTTNSRYFKQIMEQQGYDVIVVNTLKFKVINLSTNKTDKHDACTLAHFLQKSMLPTSNLCQAQNEAIRRIIKCRSLLVENNIALKNQAHAVLLAYGIQTVRSQFQSKKGRNQILEHTESPQKTILQTIFETEDILEAQIKKLEQKMKEFTADNNDISLLMTIPGIGIVNACTIVSYIDNINRFNDYKNFSSYCGLVPWVQTSNNTSYYGRITKRGPQEIRTALVQCVVAMVRMPEKTKDTNLMKTYHRMKETKNSGKAIIAIARRLSRIIYIMLKKQIPFNQNLA